jgi:hypothetical protein
MTITDTLSLLRSKRYEFEPNCFEGRYYNANGFACGIVASIGAGDWAAYIGGFDPQSEKACLQFVAKYGATLSEKDARHFFPEIELPYRS